MKAFKRITSISTAISSNSRFAQLKFILIILLIFLTGCASESKEFGANGKAESDLIHSEVARVLKENEDESRPVQEIPDSQNLKRQLRKLGKYICEVAAKGEAEKLTYEVGDINMNYVKKEITELLHEISPQLAEGRYAVKINEIEPPTTMYTPDKPTHELIILTEVETLLTIELNYYAEYKLFYLLDAYLPD